MQNEAFFAKMREQYLSLTYDDVKLQTMYSEVLPTEVSTASKFSRNVPLLIPIVSAAMDTVTESTMAIAMAKAGGLGVIHRNLTPSEQAEEVRRVKSHLNAVIAKPTTVYGDEIMANVIHRRERENLSFHTFPVLDREGRVIGLLTKHDFDLCDDKMQLVSEAMTPFSKLVYASPIITLEDAYEMMKEKQKKVLPLLNADRRIEGMYVFSDVVRIKQDGSTKYNVDNAGHLRVAAAIGTKPSTIDDAALLINEGVDVLVIDTAHGDSKFVYDTFKALKQKFPEIDVVVGNVTERASAQKLMKAGVDGIKVGQGPGAICTTRNVAGVGCAQVTAINNCAVVTEGTGIPICADGGIRNSGDIAVAIGAGAHSVMLGNLLAGTAETPGDIINVKGAQWKIYRGMGSLGAMLERSSSRERYGQQGASKEKLVPEGVKGRVPYKGTVLNHLLQYVGGLRSGMGYIGAATIEDMRQKAGFNRFTKAGQIESHPHDIDVVDETPTTERNS